MSNKLFLNIIASSLVTSIQASKDNPFLPIIDLVTMKARRKGFTGLPNFIKDRSINKPTKKRLKIKQARKAYV